MNSSDPYGDVSLTDNTFALLGLAWSIFLFAIAAPFVWLVCRLGGKRCGS